MKLELTIGRQTRRKFLASFAFMGLGGPAYARFLEPRWLEVNRQTIQLNAGSLRSPVKLLHLSDLHASPVVSLEFIAEAVQAGLALEPDVICLTGDFVTRKHGRMDRYAEVLARLPAQAPTFACLGNHDGGLWSALHDGYPTIQPVLDLLARSRITALSNTAQSVAVKGERVRFVGVGDLWSGAFAPHQAFGLAKDLPGSATILLSHNPDSKEQLKPFSWDLMLSGHTHGGQLNLPFLGAPLAPVHDKRFIQGLHPWQGRWLHITKGVGNVHGLRFNCRPEINLLTLT